MADLGTIVDNIQRTVKDPSFSEDDIFGFIDDCLQHIAGRVLLKDLESFGEVSTIVSELSIDIPAFWTFGRNIFDCHIEDVGDVTILNSVEHLNRRYPDFRTKKQDGPIQFIVPHNDKIIYYPIPKVSTVLNIGYYKTPGSVDIDETAINIIPVGLRSKLIESYVNAVIFNRKEDGIDEIKINTRKHEKIFRESLEILEDRMETGQSRKIARSVSSWV